jgi:hypothetical protein
MNQVLSSSGRQKVEFIVRSKSTRWTRKCKTLAEAKALIKADWAFNTDKKVYIERRVTDIVAV